MLGQWRDEEALGNVGKKNSKKGNKTKRIPIQAKGVFPNSNRSFKNLREFREGLVDHKHLLTRSITEGLLSYGLGRHIEFADQQAIDEICTNAASNNEQIRDLIFEIIKHPIFRRSDKTE